MKRVKEEWISSENWRQLDNWLKPSKVDHMDCGEHGICFHVLFAPEGNSNIYMWVTSVHQVSILQHFAPPDDTRHRKHFSFFVFSAFCTFQRSGSHVGKVISRLFYFIRNRLSARVYLPWVALSAVARITPVTHFKCMQHTHTTNFLSTHANFNASRQRDDEQQQQQRRRKKNGFRCGE